MSDAEFFGWRWTSWKRWKKAGRGMEDIGENTLHDSVQPRRRETKNHSGIIRKGGDHSNDGRKENGLFKRHQSSAGPDAGKV